MATSTARLGLVKPDPTDLVDVVAHLDNNYDKIDLNMNARPCLSSSRPGAPYQGQLIYETNTGYFRMWDGTVWKKQNGFIDKQQADVLTSETTTSATYIDLTTVGPSITIDMDVGQKVSVTVECDLKSSATTAGARASYDVTGAETVVASDNDAVISTNTDLTTCSKTSVFTAAVAGSHTFKMKHRSGGGVTGTYSNRRLCVEP